MKKQTIKIETNLLCKCGHDKKYHASMGNNPRFRCYAMIPFNDNAAKICDCTNFKKPITKIVRAKATKTKLK
jgi:hypothetical protein